VSGRLGGRYFLDDETKDAIRRCAKVNPDLGEREIAQRFGCSQPVIHGLLVAAGLQRVRSKAVKKRG
jgi:hypothetical protein